MEGDRSVTPVKRPTIVLAALDRSLAARPVLATAQAVAGVLGAGVVALHVQEDSAETPSELARAAGVRLRIVRGDVVDRLVAEGEADDVAALVIGARGIPTDPRPLGATAVAVATTVTKPVVVVSPEAEPQPTISRALVPLEGDLSTSLARRACSSSHPNGARGGRAARLAPDAIPAFTDQPQHEQDARAREFLARYCPWGIDGVRFETRVGSSEDQVARAARECGCDMIVLGWSQRFSEGRARVVRGTLERSGAPVMLFPVSDDG